MFIIGISRQCRKDDRQSLEIGKKNRAGKRATI